MGSNSNRFAILSKVVNNIPSCNLDNKDMLREVTIIIGLEKIDISEEIRVKVLLDSKAI